MKKIAIILLLVATVVGCKKDDSIASFTLTGDNSMDFSWGQSKDVAFTTKNVIGHNAAEVPDGWECVYVGGKYVITAPGKGDSEAELTGEVVLSVKGEKNVTLTRRVAVSARETTDLTNSANSFIITIPDTRFRFRADDLDGAVSAQRLWSTSNGAVQKVSYEDGYVYFATGAGDDFENANAVIVVLNDDGDALWSWHIWVSEEEPATVYVNGYEVMDRNLGAVSAEDFGLYYQWGRKDPFAGPVRLFDHKGTAEKHDFVTEPQTLEYAVAHPGTFISGDEETFDWLNFGNDQRWMDTKTEYDPCPAGWRVAPREVYEAFSLDNVVGGYDEGWTFDVAGEQIFLPAAGRRSFSPSLATWERNYTNIVNNENGDGFPVGFYWTSKSPKLGSPAFGIDFYSVQGVEDISEYAAGGFSVRCVEDRWR